MQLSLPFDDVISSASEPTTPPLEHPQAPRQFTNPLPAQAGRDAAVELFARDQAAVSEPARLPANFAELEVLLRHAVAAPRKTADMRSALRTAAKVLGRRMDQIPTAPAELGALLANASPMIVSVSPARWSRVKCLTLSALAAAGFDVLPGRDVQGFSPLWQDLAEGLPDKRSRIGLSRMLSYFSRQGVAPKQLTVEHVEAFGEALNARSLCRNPVQVYRSSVRIWNSMATSIPGWPKVVVPLDPDPRRYSAPWEDFPASFRDDVTSFQTNSGDPDPFSETYSPAVRPATLDLRRKQIHQLASALVASGFPIHQLTSLKVLVQPPNATAALRHLLDRRGGTPGVHLEGQARLLGTVARHWVRDDGIAEKLARISKGLHVKKTGMTAKNRQRLRQFDISQNVDALLMLPLRVFEEERRRKQPTREQALRVMRALAVEFLLVAPMRVRNLTQIEIGRHLLEFRRHKHKRYHVVFAPEETKTREPFEMELPQQTAVMLEIYLQRFRPALCDVASPYLFPGREGGKRSSVSFSQAIAAFVKREIGLTMHAHLFRQFAGKFYLDKRPHDVETIRRILGHRTTTTTLRAYAQLRTDQAFRSYDALIEAQRAANRPFAPQRDPRRANSAPSRKPEAADGREP